MTNEEKCKRIKFANIVLDVVANLNVPMLMYDEEKEVTREALEQYIKRLEQPSCESRIRELINEFDNKHPVLFADYMREFNNHSISEIIEYMWDMHDLIEDIKYRLPNEGGEEE